MDDTQQLCVRIKQGGTRLCNRRQCSQCAAVYSMFTWQWEKTEAELGRLALYVHALSRTPLPCVRVARAKQPR